MSLNKLERLAPSDVTAQLKLLRSVAKLPFFLDVASELVASRDEAFDQYTGIRQVGDLRGIPQQGAKLYAAAKRVVDQLFAFSNCVLLFILANVHNDVAHNGGSLGPLNLVSQVCKAGFATLPTEFDRMLATVVES